MSSGPVLGIDVGGTTVKARLVDERGQALGDWRMPTPVDDRSGRNTVALVADLVSQARERTRVSAVGVVVPGIVDDATGMCLRAVNLGWTDLPLRDLLVARIAEPLAFGQDVRAGALAEGVSGAAANYPGSYVFVPIGTGLASAIGSLGTVATLAEWPGEIGQELIVSGPHAGRRVEEIASASGVAKAAGAADARSVAELVRQGHPAATLVWNNAVEVLADSLGQVVTNTDVRLIILGGGLAEAGSLLLDPLRLALHARIPAVEVELRRAAHGDAAGMLGAIIMAQRLHANS